MRNSLPFSKPYRAFYLSAIALAIFGGVWLYISKIFEGQSFVGCPSKLLFHIPCPGCGMTRATLCLLQGDVLSAIRYNPNSVVFVPLFIIEGLLGIADVLMSKVRAYNFFSAASTFMGKPKVFAVFVVFELLVWLHNLVAGI